MSTREYPPHVNITAPTFAELPPFYVDGALGTTQDTDSVYVYDATSATWILATASAILTPASVADTATVDLTVTLGVLTADVVAGSIGNTQLASGIDATKVADGTVTSTEFQFINSVTSNVQTQIDSKQGTGSYITALTGDVAATGPGSATATLAAVNGNVGTFGTTTQVGSFTVNAKGLITAASNITITPANIGAQPVDAGLTSIAALASTGVIASTAADTYALRTLTVGGDAAAFTITNPAGIAGNPTFATTFLRTANATNASFTPTGDTATTTAASATNLQSATVTFSTDFMEFVVEIGVGANERQAIKCFAAYATATVTALSDPGTLFLGSDAGTGVFISKSATSAVVSIKNRMGGTRAIRVSCQDTIISAATAWA